MDQKARRKRNSLTAPGIHVSTSMKRPTEGDDPCPIHARIEGPTRVMTMPSERPRYPRYVRGRATCAGS